MTWDRDTKNVEYQKDATTRLSHRKLNGDQSQGRHFDTWVPGAWIEWVLG